MLLEDAHVGVHDRRIRSSELSVARLGHGVGFANSSRLFIDVDAARFGALCCRRGGRAAWSGRAYLAVRNLFALVWLLARPRRSKELEILVLRHELAMLRRQARQPKLTLADRGCWQR